MGKLNDVADVVFIKTGVSAIRAEFPGIARNILPKFFEATGVPWCEEASNFVVVVEARPFMRRPSLWRQEWRHSIPGATGAADIRLGVVSA